MEQLKVLLWILMAELATSTVVDSFIFTNGFIGSKLILDGIASITEDGLLRLTNDTKDSTGHAIYPTPFHFLQPSTNKAVSFSTTFVLAMIPHDLMYHGHGMAFFIAPTSNFSMANASNSLGLFNHSNNGDSSNQVVAVEFDTTLDANYDIDSNHLGININGLTSNLSYHAGYFDDQTGEFHNLSLLSGELMQVWVDYDGGEMKFNVTLSPIQMMKPKKPLLSLLVNLSSVLFSSMYIGFSSSTSTVVAFDHYILGWSFKLNGLVPEALNLSTLPSLPKHVTTKGKPKDLITIWLPVGSVVLLVSSVAIVILIMVRRKIKLAELVEDWELQYGTHRFSYKTLFKATKGFKDKQLLGVGGFGKVYKGVLPKSNIEVAVKRVSHESRQGMREFIAEIVTLGQLRHRNLVQLLGYCRRKGELLLVYDYMANGSVGNFLHCKDKPALNWSQRLHIIRGVASGLEYLHEDWEQVVIHRDIKTNNVLLDSELNGKLSDFGLARLYDHDMDPQTTQVAGTMGYIAPEFARSGRPTTLTDVFAFGVFVLEVACGRRPIDFKLKGDNNQIVLVDWVLENWKKGTILDSIDQRLGNEYNMVEIELVLELGLLCSHPLPALRPSMKQVVQFLNGDAPLPQLSLAFSNFNLLALQQNEGFDKCLLSYPNSSTIQSSDHNIADLIE